MEPLEQLHRRITEVESVLPETPYRDIVALSCALYGLDPTAVVSFLKKNEEKVRYLNGELAVISMLGEYIFNLNPYLLLAVVRGSNNPFGPKQFSTPVLYKRKDYEAKNLLEIFDVEEKKRGRKGVIVKALTEDVIASWRVGFYFALLETLALKKALLLRAGKKEEYLKSREGVRALLVYHFGDGEDVDRVVSELKRCYRRLEEGKIVDKFFSTIRKLLGW